MIDFVQQCGCYLGGKRFINQNANNGYRIDHQPNFKTDQKEVFYDSQTNKGRGKRDAHRHQKAHYQRKNDIWKINHPLIIAPELLSCYSGL